jgi:hypothetical protein
MAGEDIAQCADRKQLFDTLREATAHIALHSSNFSQQFGTAVDNGNNVFQISARGKFLLPAARKRLCPLKTPSKVTVKSFEARNRF